MPPYIPPEVVNEILSQLYYSLSRPDQVGEKLEAFVTLSLVSKHFRALAKQQLFRSFPLTSNRKRFSHFQKLTSHYSHRPQVTGVDFVRNSEGDSLTAEELDRTWEGTLQYCSSYLKFLSLDLELRPKTPSKRFFLWWDSFRHLKHLESLAIIGGTFNLYLDHVPLQLARTLKHLRVSGTTCTEIKRWTGPKNLSSLDLSNDQGWILSEANIKSVKTLWLSLFAQNGKIFIKNEMAYQHLTSLQYLFIKFRSHSVEHAQIGSEEFRTHFQSYPCQLIVLRIQIFRRGKLLKLILNGYDIPSLSNLKRLELCGPHGTVLADQIIQARALLKKLGKRDVEVVMVGKGDPFGAW